MTAPPAAPRPAIGPLARELLEQEAQALMVRLDNLRPLVLTETMVIAAALPYRAHRTIERFLYESRRDLRRQVRAYLKWLGGPGRAASAAEQQGRFVLIRLRFNDVLAQLDLFTEVVTQRSEHGNGIWLSGLDALAADALDVPGVVDPPPLICYLARGPGAAIRRARTRLPGDRPNPVAIIRVPRERMIGNGVASSLVHEVGHQGAALLDLVPSLRREIEGRSRRSGPREAAVWRSWGTTVSECVADLWSIATLGIASTIGLLAVVSLPRYFVFRPNGEDPHPTPWIRVLLSAAVGDELYPHPQWSALAGAWKAYYPVAELPQERRRALADLASSLPDIAGLLADHRPERLGGATLAETLADEARRPERLLALHQQWRSDLAVLARQRPALVLAVLGQARAASLISPRQESDLLSAVLSAWAVRSSLDVLERSQRPVGPQPVTPLRHPVPHLRRSTT